MKNRVALKPKYYEKGKSKQNSILENKKEFPLECVVSINGRDMNEYRWVDRNDAPIFTGIVQDPFHHDGREAESIDESCESMVTFVLTDHYEWLDTNVLNVMSGVFNDVPLNMIAILPKDYKK